MLDREDRLFVAMVRTARSIKITVNEGCSDALTLRFDDSKAEIRKLTHDVAIALQDFLNKTNDGESGRRYPDEKAVSARPRPDRLY